MPFEEWKNVGKKGEAAKSLRKVQERASRNNISDKEKGVVRREIKQLKDDGKLKQEYRRRASVLAIGSGRYLNDYHPDRLINEFALHLLRKELGEDLTSQIDQEIRVAGLRRETRILEREKLKKETVKRPRNTQVKAH